VTGIVAPQRIDAAIAARKRNTASMLDRVRAALRDLHRERGAVTVSAVQRRAGVSRAFLYQNTEARKLVIEATTQADTQRSQTRAAVAATAESAWRERALNAEDALKTAYQEIHGQRARLGELLGRIRDLELDLPEDAVQRLVTENTTLKQQIRALTTEVGNLAERLASARSNNRSQDKKIADLQAQLLDPPPIPRNLRPV
jgi:hypothetical protein